MQGCVTPCSNKKTGRRYRRVCAEDVIVKESSSPTFSVRYGPYPRQRGYNSSELRTKKMPSLNACRGYWLPPSYSDDADPDLDLKRWKIGVPKCSWCGKPSSYLYQYIQGKIKALDPSLCLDSTSGTWAMMIMRMDCCGFPSVVWGNGLPAELVASEAAAEDVASRRLPPLSSFYWSLSVMDAYGGLR